MNFYKLDFLFCFAMGFIASILCGIISRDNEDAESKGVGQGLIVVVACVLIALAILAALIKWLF